jgi:hypothetical protein
MDSWIHPNRSRFYLMLGVGLWLIYAALSLLAPVRNNTFHLTKLELSAIQLTIILPILAIWVIAIFGAATFKRYAGLIRKSADGSALNLISNGLLLVVTYFILQGILGALPNYLVGTPALKPVIIINNHLPMLVSVAAFGLILAGALKLRGITSRRMSTGGLTAIVFPYAVLGAIYAWNFYHSVPLATVNGIPKFAVPGKMPFFTLALPYIAIWLMGVLAVTIVAEYARTVNGKVYRLVLKDLVRGLSGVLAFSILVQVIQLSAGLFRHMAIGGVLIVIYIILVLYAVGFIFIARGARKLMMIEQSL